MYSPEFLYRRDPYSHKGDYGHALLVAGSYGKMGAAVLAARACLRSGVGLLTVHVPRFGVTVMQTAVPEAMLSIDDDDCRFTSLPLHLDRYDAVAVGPGIGTDNATESAFMSLLSHYSNGFDSSLPANLVIDADGLNLLARHQDSMYLVKGAVLTPHAKEYERLFGQSEPQYEADMNDVVIVKKTHRTTVYAPRCTPLVNYGGNAGMATAGSGDVLTGITLGLLAQWRAYGRRHGSDGASLQQVAALAVHLHSAAGDKAACMRSQPSVIASDIVDSI